MSYLCPYLHQERERRPGTVNVAGAVGLATAFTLAEDCRVEECRRLRDLRNQLIDGILTAIPDSTLTGHPRQRLCNIASFIFRGIEGESLVAQLDQIVVAAADEMVIFLDEAAAEIE